MRQTITRIKEKMEQRRKDQGEASRVLESQYDNKFKIKKNGKKMETTGRKRPARGTMHSRSLFPLGPHRGRAAQLLAFETRRGKKKFDSSKKEESLPRIPVKSSMRKSPRGKEIGLVNPRVGKKDGPSPRRRAGRGEDRKSSSESRVLFQGANERAADKKKARAKKRVKQGWQKPLSKISDSGDYQTVSETRKKEARPQADRCYANLTKLEEKINSDKGLRGETGETRMSVRLRKDREVTPPQPKNSCGHP